LKEQSNMLKIELIESFDDDYFPCRRRRCKLEHISN
jgi:hypothetical protein